MKDVTKVAPYGQTIKGRIQELCAEVAKDIKNCANTCDTYSKLVEIQSVSFALTPPLARGFSRKYLRVRSGKADSRSSSRLLRKGETNSSLP